MGLVYMGRWGRLDNSGASSTAESRTSINRDLDIQDCVNGKVDHHPTVLFLQARLTEPWKESLTQGIVLPAVSIRLGLDVDRGRDWLRWRNRLVWAFRVP